MARRRSSSGNLRLRLCTQRRQTGIHVICAGSIVHGPRSLNAKYSTSGDAIGDGYDADCNID